ncbi:hypothetical protein AMAG_05700 [Allomyces macrogynus ATCC 38327]|uniref:F-box domain-containing protein n=1 Tax=Allomyces macrogynus (strain ATCC 38327) TaxID=578462 RepID=A0A0L0SCY3_ALLM3|nr:hypothetical protein AMAG_05700 [Allomyces macrogynus ATCC 38327]|eukprot:KNE60297.1 hypothetical protein AMAG_05700 [Allomyces macrogynus ATCC 38327]
MSGSQALALPNLIPETGLRTLHLSSSVAAAHTLQALLRKTLLSLQDLALQGADFIDQCVHILLELFPPKLEHLSISAHRMTAFGSRVLFQRMPLKSLKLFGRTVFHEVLEALAVWLGQNTQLTHLRIDNLCDHGSNVTARKMLFEALPSRIKTLRLLTMAGSDEPMMVFAKHLPRLVQLQALDSGSSMA